MAPKKDTIDTKQIAAQYGWALAVLRSDPSLYAVFQKAAAGGWTQARFQAEVRSTKWFQTHSDAQRNAQILRETDPAAWKSRVASTTSAIRDMAAAMGANTNAAWLRTVTNNVLNFGWNDSQIRDVLAAAVHTTNGLYQGAAAGNADHLRQTALNNGVKLSDASLQGWVSRIAAGEGIAGFDSYLRNTAASAFPQWEKEIRNGMDVRQIVEPYVQQMASTLELDPNSIDLFDPTLRKALQGKDEKGAAGAVPLWQWDTMLKQDTRFDATKQARTQAAQFATQLSKMFGA